MQQVSCPCLLARKAELTPVLSASGYSLYLGATTITRCPLAARAGGKDPQTSPRPPVFDQGATCVNTQHEVVAAKVPDFCTVTRCDQSLCLQYCLTKLGCKSNSSNKNACLQKQVQQQQLAHLRCHKHYVESSLCLSRAVLLCFILQIIVRSVAVERLCPGCITALCVFLGSGRVRSNIECIGPSP